MTGHKAEAKIQELIKIEQAERKRQRRLDQLDEAFQTLDFDQILSLLEQE